MVLGYHHTIREYPIITAAVHPAGFSAVIAMNGHRVFTCTYKTDAVYLRLVYTIHVKLQLQFTT